MADKVCKEDSKWKGELYKGFEYLEMGINEIKRCKKKVLSLKYMYAEYTYQG